MASLHMCTGSTQPRHSIEISRAGSNGDLCIVYVNSGCYGESVPVATAYLCNPASVRWKNAFFKEQVYVVCGFILAGEYILLDTYLQAKATIWVLFEVNLVPLACEDLTLNGWFSTIFIDIVLTRSWMGSFIWLFTRSCGFWSLLACVKIVFVENLDDGWINFNHLCIWIACDKTLVRMLTITIRSFTKELCPFCLQQISIMCRVLYSVSHDSI